MQKVFGQLKRIGELTYNVFETVRQRKVEAQNVRLEERRLEYYTKQKQRRGNVVRIDNTMRFTSIQEETGTLEGQNVLVDDKGGSVTVTAHFPRYFEDDEVVSPLFCFNFERTPLGYKTKIFVQDSTDLEGDANAAYNEYKASLLTRLGVLLGEKDEMELLDIANSKINEFVLRALNDAKSSLPRESKSYERISQIEEGYCQNQVRGFDLQSMTPILMNPVSPISKEYRFKNYVELCDVNSELATQVQKIAAMNSSSDRRNRREGVLSIIEGSSPKVESIQDISRKYDYLYSMRELLLAKANATLPISSSVDADGQLKHRYHSLVMGIEIIDGMIFQMQKEKSSEKQSLSYLSANFPYMGPSENHFINRSHINVDGYRDVEHVKTPDYAHFVMAAMIRGSIGIFDAEQKFYYMLTNGLPNEVQRDTFEMIQYIPALLDPKTRDSGLEEMMRIAGVNSIVALDESLDLKPYRVILEMVGLSVEDFEQKLRTRIVAV